MRTYSTSSKEDVPGLPFLESLLVLTVHLGYDALGERELQEICGASPAKMHAALRRLHQLGLIESEGRPGCWRRARPFPGLLEAAVHVVRDNVTESSLPFYLGNLLATASLDECELAMRRFEQAIRQGDAGSVTCMSLVLRYLKHQGELFRGGAPLDLSRYMELLVVALAVCPFFPLLGRYGMDLCAAGIQMLRDTGCEREAIFLSAVGCYLGLFVPGVIPAAWQDCLRNIVPEALVGGKNIELKKLLCGVIYYVRGEYANVLRCYEQKACISDWKINRLLTILDSCASQSAFYIRHYNIALGVYESSRRTAALSGDRVLTRFWMLHLAFAMLRLGDWETALLNLDCLYTGGDGGGKSKYYFGAVRGIAIYHYLNGNPLSAYALLRCEMRKVVEEGGLHAPFEDPLVLDMLLAFEQMGLPGLPLYELDYWVRRGQAGINAQMRGAAFRIAALRTPHETERMNLLLQSLQALQQADDIRERDLTVYVLSTMVSPQTRDAVLNAHGIRSRRLPGHLRGCATYSDAVRVATLPSSAADRRQAPAGEQGKSSFREQCSAALGEHMSAQSPLGHVLTVSQLLLGAERCALFRLRGKGDLHCELASNLSQTERQSRDMQARLSWIEECARAQAGPHWPRGERKALCLTLPVTAGEPWVLFLESIFTTAEFSRLPLRTLQDVAFLFSAEIRAQLRTETGKESGSQRKGYPEKTADGQMSRSPALLLTRSLIPLLDKARLVAPTDAPVLLLGESGVGKEVLARKLHELSGRRGRFVPVHPASLSEALFESELFGHEKGAFTGADRARAGLLELADGGTLFIDEVGEIPPSMQVKLLRVLQDNSFFRVGGTQLMRSAFRIIAATNRDLLECVRKGEFRKDLFYRICTVSLSIPPLRERPADIAIMARAFHAHFQDRYARRLPTLSPVEIDRLCRQHWPGNVRQLLSVIEQAVIFEESPSCILDAAASDGVQVCNTGLLHEDGDFSAPFGTGLRELEEQYLRHVHARLNGKINGPGGMIELLGIKRSTLYGKLRQYGIETKPHEKSSGR